MNFEKLTVQTTQRLKRVGVSIALILVLTISTYVAQSLLNTKVLAVKEQYAEYQTALATLESLNRSIKQSEEIINDNTGLIAKSFMTREEFVKFIGNACQETSCEILQLQGGDVTVDNSINKINFKIEVRGELPDLYRLMQRVDGLDARYALVSTTLRKMDDFAWLDRYQLDAFTLDWWDLSDKEDTTATDEPIAVSLDSIFGNRKMSLYLDVDFITSDSLG